MVGLVVIQQINTSGVWGAGSVLKVGKIGPLSKAAQFNHCLSLCQELLQRMNISNFTVGCSQQNFLRDQAWQNGVASSWGTRQGALRVGSIK